jgi:heat shock protein HtpX
LSQEELAGVIAHEMAHIRNRDTLTMTVSATVSGAIAMISQFGLFFGGGSRDRPMGPMATILMAILAPMAAMVIQMTISRTREYAADRLGAEICRNPMWLASALVKISNKHNVMMSAERFPSTAHLFITNPLTGRGTDSLFSTHPDIRNRVAELKEMAKEMGHSATPLPRIEPMQRRLPWGVGRRRTLRTGAPRRKSPWG